MRALFLLAILSTSCAEASTAKKHQPAKATAAPPKKAPPQKQPPPATCHQLGADHQTVQEIPCNSKT